MIEAHFISTKTICIHYEIEISFVNELSKMGLIQIEEIEQDQFIHQDQIGDLEKIIRLHQELDLNLEAIDIIFNLLEKERDLRKEIITLKNRLRLYESD
ncbi:chaperone modulator CbpM [Algoriphagus sp.]|uniref:chaperone modulator CbpM n=1 Tax=Algoriphagus sp. TaxID=1872435 RepID=UPI0025FEAF87|nr:chaperone modulator CbpM [Algoriphagus sp.]